MIDKQNGGLKRVLDHTLQTALIFTMNANEVQFKQHHYDVVLGDNGTSLRAVFGYCETLYSFDTFQYIDYAKYDCDLFDAEHKAKMQVIKYYQAENQAHWREEISKGDWSAAELLRDWLEKGKLKQMCGDSTKVYMLTDGDKLVSFATLAPQDEIDAPDLSPWIGFVYTFPAYRGHRNAGKLITHICEVLKSDGTEKAYISTDEIGLYEKYGFTFWQTMPTREGKPTRVYVKRL